MHKSIPLIYSNVYDQALGAVGGVLAIHEVLPPRFKSMLAGPSLKVDLHTGAMAEGILTFMITFLVLLIIVKGPSNPILKTLMIATTIVTMIVTGSTYTGPSMNPVNVSHLFSCISLMFSCHLFLFSSPLLFHLKSLH